MSLFDEYIENCVKALELKRDNARKLKIKKKVKAQKNEILELKAMVYDLKNHLEYTRETVYQLIGRIYNQETQKETIDNMLTFLYTGRNVDLSEEHGDTKCDENAKSIESMSTRLDELLERSRNLAEENADTAYTVNDLDEKLYALVGCMRDIARDYI
jgi:hypothetical protein